MKRIANNLKQIGAKVTGRFRPSNSKTGPTLSVVALNEHGKPVRVPIAALKGSTTGKHPRLKVFTDTVVFDAGKAE